MFTCSLYDSVLGLKSVGFSKFGIKSLFHLKINKKINNLSSFSTTKRGMTKILFFNFLS